MKLGFVLINLFMCFSYMASAQELQSDVRVANLKLSEKRAKAVAKELASKYNISLEKIVIERKGSKEQPYPENKWNR